jgi:hypothetical protein
MWRGGPLRRLEDRPRDQDDDHDGDGGRDHVEQQLERLALGPQGIEHRLAYRM